MKENTIILYMEYICDSLMQTKEVVRDFLKDLIPLQNKATTIELIGDLGSGKTTFTQYLAKELGVQEMVISPTFVIQKRYPILNHSQFKNLIHIDAYRIENPEEIKTIALEKDLQNKENLILIEWPSKIKEHITDSIKINFDHVNETTRKISW